MPRALIAEWRTVGPSELPNAKITWRKQREHLFQDGCHFWVYASADAPERVLEFTEASDVATLRAARLRAGLAERADLILTEVELD